MEEGLPWIGWPVASEAQDRPKDKEEPDLQGPKDRVLHIKEMRSPTGRKKAEVCLNRAEAGWGRLENNESSGRD